MLFAALATGTGVAFAQADPQTQAFFAARQVTQGALDGLASAKSMRTRFCAAAELADTALFEKAQVPSSESNNLAQLAQAQRAMCDDAMRQVQSADEALKIAREVFRNLAAASPAIAAGAVPAALAAPSVPPPVVVLASPSAVVTPLTQAPLRWPTKGQLEAVVKAAEKAQADVEKLRGKVSGLYEVVDSATAQALQLTKIDDKDYFTKASKLQAQANASKALRSTAQSAANALIGHALILKPCALQYTATCAQASQVAYEAGVRDQAVLQDAQDRAGRLADDVVDAALTIDAAKKWPKDVDRARAYQFSKLLADYPAAKAPFSKDGYEVLAGSKSVASLQWGLNKFLPAGWSRVSAKVSAPLTDNRTDLFGSADGLANLRSFGLAWQAAGLRGKLVGTEQWLLASSLELGWGYETRKFYDDSPVSFSSTKRSETVSPWQVGGNVALHEPGSSNAHLFTLKGQRTFDLAPAQIRCPVDKLGDLAVVQCINGSFGPPKPQSSALVGYEFRYKGANFALSPSVLYDTHSRVTTLALPLFRVQSADDDKRPLNAGVRLEWNSKGKTSITERTESTWTWGVFVGAPFDLFGGRD